MAADSVATPRPAAGAKVDPDYPLTEVPASARRGLWSLIVVLTGFTFFTPTMLAGAQIGASFAFTPFLWVVAAGSAILGVYVAALAVVGARSGLTTVLLSRYTLGTGGAKWADLLLGGTQVGWYAVTIAFFAQLLAQAFGWQQGGWLIIVLGGVAMGITAYYGYRGLEILSAVSVPLLFVFAFWLVARAVSDAGGWTALQGIQATQTMSVATALTIIVGTFASGGTQTPNWSRFARFPWQAFMAGLAAFFIAEFLMLLFGGIGAVVYQQGDFVAVLIQLNLILIAVVFLGLSLWTTQDNTAYAFGVAGAELFDVNSKRPFIIGGVALAIVLALTGIYEFLPQYLILLGVFIPPLGGAIIGDYVFTWRGKLPALATVHFSRFRWSCIAAYLLGTAAAYFGELAGVGIPPIQGVLVATLAVPLFEAIFRAAGVDQRPTVEAAA